MKFDIFNYSFILCFVALLRCVFLPINVRGGGAIMARKTLFGWILVAIGFIAILAVVFGGTVVLGGKYIPDDWKVFAALAGLVVLIVASSMLR